MTTIAPCPAARHRADGPYPDPACHCQHRTDHHGKNVDATRTRRQLQALIADGYRWADLGHELGVTECVVIRWATAPRVHRDTQHLVDALYCKATSRMRSPRTKPGAGAQRGQWLPSTAWAYGDINNTHPLAEVTALLAWLDAATDPEPALAELLRRVERLPLIARQIMARRGAGAYRLGDDRVVIHQCELIYRRDKKTTRRAGAVAA